MSQTRIMSIHQLPMRLFPAFCGGKALNGNVKHFVWPDLWRHRWPRGQIFKLYVKDLVQAFPLPFEFFPTSVGFRDRWGGWRYAPPPPPPVEGRGRTRLSRARVKEHLSLFLWNKNGFETTHYVILAYFVFTLTGYDMRRSYCEAELLRGKVIQLGARDTNKLWECTIPANQSTD